ncbi:MAG: 16S rRNA (guanine(966)-N(2))-methyltransferase RsmD [Acidobacteriota bacterium]
MSRRGGGGRLRLSGGAHRGRVLKVPAGARPTEARVREALFSSWGERLGGARLLDLYAGSGAIALEAAGRGALDVVAVEGNPKAAEMLEENRQALGETGIVRVLRLRLPLGLAKLRQRAERPFDLIFADPPYAFTDHPGLLGALEPLLAAEGEAVLEHDSRRDPPLVVGSLVRVRKRRYGECALSSYRRATVSQDVGSQAGSSTDGDPNEDGSHRDSSPSSFPEDSRVD